MTITSGLSDSALNSGLMSDSVAPLDSEAKRLQFEQQAIPLTPYLYSIALSKTKGNYFDAEDLVQETFIKAFKAWHQFQQGTELKNWLSTILQNTFINKYNKKKKDKAVDGLDELEDYQLGTAESMSSVAELSAEMAALQLVQADQNWKPLSLSPSRTLASLLCALCALALLLLTTTLGHAARWRLIGVVAIAGAITLSLGAAQIKGEAGNPLRFYNPAQVWLTGFFANHNSAADFILIALIACTAIAWRSRSLASSPWSIAVVLIAIDVALLTGLFLTDSPRFTPL